MFYYLTISNLLRCHQGWSNRNILTWSDTLLSPQLIGKNGINLCVSSQRKLQRKKDINFTSKMQMSQNSLAHTLLRIVDEWITDLRQKSNKQTNKQTNKLVPIIVSILRVFWFVDKCERNIIFCDTEICRKPIYKRDNWTWNYPFSDHWPLL